MFKTTRPLILAASLALIGMLPATAETIPTPQESAFWNAEVEAGNLPPVHERLPADPLQRRHQNRHQQGNDGDHDQKLDQCEAASSVHKHIPEFHLVSRHRN